MHKEKEINAFYDGMIEGITLYAHWKDGVQYVARPGKLLRRHWKMLKKSEKKNLK